MSTKNRTNEGSSGLTPVQEKLIEALLQQPTIKAAALSVGIHERTARRHLQDPLFASCYAAAKQEMLAELRSSLLALAVKSIEGLSAAMDDSETPHAIRMRAYQLALDRVVPVQGIPTQTEQQRGMIPSDLLQYATDDELEQMTRLVETLQARRDAKIEKVHEE